MSHAAHCNFVSPAQTEQEILHRVRTLWKKIKNILRWNIAVEWSKYLRTLTVRTSGDLVARPVLQPNCSLQWPMTMCAYSLLFRKTPLPQRLQTSELRDIYVWADSCKGTLRCFSKSAYLIFYRYCEYKYPMYLTFTFPLTWSKYLLLSVSLIVWLWPCAPQWLPCNLLYPHSNPYKAGYCDSALLYWPRVMLRSGVDECQLILYL